LEKVFNGINFNYYLLAMLMVIFSVAISIYHPLLYFILSVLAIIILSLKRNFFLIGIPVLIILLLYVPGIHLPFAVIVLFLTALYFTYKNKKIFKQPVFLTYLLYLVCLIISFLYAIDELFAIKYTSLAAIGLIGIVIGIGIKQSDEINYEWVLKGLVRISVILSIVNITFFLFPEMEIEFLKSEFAKWVINPGSLETLFGESRNNILDPAKAGTVFLNTNVGSVFFNILTWISLSLFLYNKKTIYLGLTIIHIAAMFSTNSRSGVIGLLVSGIVIFFILSMKNKKTISYFFFGIPISVISLIVILFLGNFSNIINRMTLTALENDPRVFLWKSIPKIVDNRFLGLGFGGWEQFFNLPAHNIALITWLQSGVLGVSTLTTFMFLVIKYGIAQMKENLYATSLVGSSLCILIQGMFDNYFLNDIRVSLIFFLLVGLFAQPKDMKIN